MSPEDILRMVRGSRLFSGLTEEEFREVLSLLRTKTVSEGDLLLAAGGDDANLYIVRKGRALIRSAEKSGKDPIVGVVEAGGMINEFAFITQAPDEETVEAATPLLLWYISRDEFGKLLANSDTIAAHLKYSEEELAVRTQKKRFGEQRPGEKILWFSRRHWWAFLKGQFLTILLGIILVLLFAAPAGRGFVFSPLGSLFAFVIAIVAVASFAWNAYDYWNDYFVITDQRVIHRERVLLIYDQQDESPMGKIQNVTVTRPGFAAFLFDVGNIEIETQGARANVAFSTVGKPDVPNRIIRNEQARAVGESGASERSKVRSELRRVMKVGDEPGEGGKKEEANRRPPLSQRLALNLAKRRKDLLPRMRLVHGKEIVWRRHWLYLLQTIILPTLSLIAFVVGLLFVRAYMPDLAAALFSVPLVYVVFLTGFLLSFWFVWQYENWRNDLYILTPDALIDYKRSPFGLLGTQQKTANLANVQNVSATTKGFIDALFNMGDVAIRTGGVENEILFARVWDPRGVQSDIVKALEEFQTSQRDAEAARRRREFIEWIGIYDELTRIHTERKPLV